MDAEELAFLESWEIRRRKWRWGRVFFNTILYIAVPVVLTIDFINFFIIADTNFGFFSLEHLWEFLKTLLVFSLIIGSSFGVFYWYSNELKFQRLTRKQEKENKNII
ncbi:hypothetical protein [Pedobacter glucosidilyticus]|uniref:hypothetical protein n=1 Tax=Pedobacter glucosidilyticus TaxID=1122941 RepID=UPI000413FFB5|nr:hypothetical protein [Pedobacter glucosidilyticus]